MTMDYYTDIYAPITVPHFVNWLEGRDPWVNDFMGVMEDRIGKALDKFKKQFFIHNGQILLPSGYVSFDVAFNSWDEWEPGIGFPTIGLPMKMNNFNFRIDGTIWINLPDPIQFSSLKDLPNPFDFNPDLNTQGYSSNPRYSDPSLLEMNECEFGDVVFPANITEAFKCFITADGNTKVPYFGRNLKYLIDYQFKTCTMAQITCNDSTGKRLVRLLDSLWYCFIAILVCTGLQVLTGIPTMMFIPIVPIFALIILTNTWNWTLSCNPNVPLCFADDLYAFVETYLIPDCFCSYFPALSDTCHSGFCHFISGSTTFASCTQIEEFGYLWVPFFYAKKYIPDTLKWVHYVLYRNTALTAWMATLDLPVTQLEQDCAQLHVLDLSYPLAALLVGIFVVPRMVGLLVRMTFASVNLVLSLLSLLYSTCLSLDRSTMEMEPIMNAEPRALSLLPIKAVAVPENVDRKNTKLDRVPTAGYNTSKRLRFRNR